MNYKIETPFFSKLLHYKVKTSLKMINAKIESDLYKLRLNKPLPDYSNATKKKILLLNNL